MSVARSTVTEEVPIGREWLHPVAVWSDRAKTVGVGIATASAVLRKQPQVPAATGQITMTVESGDIALNDNVCQVRLPAEVSALLSPGDYELVLDLVYAAGGGLQLRKPVRLVG